MLCVVKEIDEEGEREEREREGGGPEKEKERGRVIVLYLLSSCWCSSGLLCVFANRILCICLLKREK